jgi:hypothetical protein
MSKVVAYVSDLGLPTEQVMIHCPGCKFGHSVTTRSKNAGGSQWGWNGSLTSPTFTPSLLVRSDVGVCHSFVKDGFIQFLGDCDHELKNQTVLLPEF